MHPPSEEGLWKEEIWFEIFSKLPDTHPAWPSWFKKCHFHTSWVICTSDSFIYSAYVTSCIHLDSESQSSILQHSHLECAITLRFRSYFRGLQFFFFFTSPFHVLLWPKCMRSGRNKNKKVFLFICIIKNVPYFKLQSKIDQKERNIYFQKHRGGSSISFKISFHRNRLIPKLCLLTTWGHIFKVS